MTEEALDKGSEKLEKLIQEYQELLIRVAQRFAKPTEEDIRELRLEAVQLVQEANEILLKEIRKLRALLSS